MQRKAYVPGAVMLLTALLAACTGGSGGDDTADGSRSADSTTSATAAQPGKYHTLTDACSAVSHGMLDSLMPGIKQIADRAQRDRAYEGEADLTYNNDRRSGCRWKAESADTTAHLHLDLERVVSYDNTVSDDNRAREVFADKAKSANIPLPSSSSSSGSSSGPGSTPPDGSGNNSSSSADATAMPSGSPSAPASGSPSATDTPTDLQPRALDDLGDEAFLNDQQGTGRQHTVTVVFRTSNVIVTLEYDEQPPPAKTAPSSQDMQDRAQKLAQRLAGSLG
ncbi:hypothetical protein [Streptomyces colonosanans]|uniref:DUF3558 domain-containing protein n=1 Tax=Streptomyces colonosanans TaxID=1428652 RepID=A0A1S2Q4K3_9ACTN|nr:hypothetical protein [Streptomyces colonosanans]OIK00125.1 hypothetical protein BIV24_03680 [Streptomyces colonosanans]